MYWTVLWVGVVTGVVAHIIDFVLWSFVFTKGIGELSSLHGDKDKMKAQMGSMVAQSFINTLVFGILLVLVYARLRSGLWATGVLGGMEFGTILWLPTIAISSISNCIWLDKVRPLAWASFWTWLIRLNVAGIVAALLMR